MATEPTRQDDIPAPILQGVAPPPFAGREAEVATLGRTLAAARQVVVHGEAGIGKSALVDHLLELVQAEEERVAQIVFSFHGAPSPAILAAQIEGYLARARTAPSELAEAAWGGRDALERLPELGAMLRDPAHRNLIVVLHNGEVVADGASPYCDAERQAVRDFLAQLAGAPLRLVVTARDALTPLVADRVARFALAGVSGDGRAELLHAYCAYIESLPALEGNAGGRQQLLDLLGGHPLATRMAAFCLGHLDLAAVVDGMKARLAALRDSQAPLPSAVVAAALGLALDTLPESRRAVLTLLGVLRGAFWERSLIGLVEGEEFPATVVPDRSRETLEAAIRHAGELGLVHPDRDRPFVLYPQAAAHDTLAALWPVIHEGDLLRALEVYTARYWSSAADALRTQGLPDQERIPHILAFCGVEEANLRHALTLAEANVLWEEARPLLFILLNVWARSHRDHDAARLRRHWLDLLSHGDGRPRHRDNPKAMDLWRFLWGHEANWLLTQGEAERAERIHLRVAEEEEGRDEPDDQVLAGIYFRIAATYEERKVWDRAQAWQEKALRIRTRLTDPHGMAACHEHLGLIEMGRSNHAAAVAQFDEAIALRERAEDVRGASDVYLQLARAQHKLGHLDTARDALMKALEGYEMRQEKPLIAATYQQLAAVHAARGAVHEAIEAAKRSLAIRNQLGDMEGMAANQGQIARLAEQQGDAGAAVEAAIQSFALLSRIASPRTPLAAGELRRLRAALGPERFDGEWRRLANDTAMPAWLAS